MTSLAKLCHARFPFAPTPQVTELVLYIIPKQSKTPYNDLKLAILGCVEKPKSQLGQYLLAEMHSMLQGLQPVESRYHENKRDDMSSTTITREMEFDAEQYHTYNRKRYKDLSTIAGDSKSEREEETVLN